MLLSLPKHDHLTLFVPALHCPDELALIEKRLQGLAGVGMLAPNYLERTLRVEFDQQRVDAGRILDELRRVGFEADLATSAAAGPSFAKAPLRLSAVLGGLLLAGAIALRLAAGETNLAVALLATASAVCSGWPVAKAAWRAVRLRALDMNALVTIAVVGALAIGEYFEASTAMFLFSISLWLESFSVGRARRVVRSLIELAPTVAHRIGPGSGAEHRDIERVAPERLMPGDLVLVRPGERIPVDGEVQGGFSAVNQAPITGESMPVEKDRGATVYAGTLNGEGSLEVRVTRPAAESTLAHVVRLISQTQAARGPTERFVDRFARRYTPAVIVLAVLLAALPPLLAQVGVAWAASATASQWLHRGLVLLVIACPCALVISTPVTILCGLYRAARRGMLIKGGEHLENAGRIDSLAIDKTGTLTTSQAEVVGIEPAGGWTAEEVLRRAAALERHSEHPLAAAIVAAAEQRGLALPPVERFAALRGFGVEGTVAGRKHYVGSPRWMQESFAAALPNGDAAFTQAMVVCEGAVIGTIALADTLRDDARAAIAELKELGVRPIALLTGDREPVARRLAAELSLDEVHADLLPEDKVERVRLLAGKRPYLAMVGDGVNDAPALAAARLGIALGSQASDTALETADVVVMTPELKRLPELVRLGRRCRRLLRQNIAFALAAKAAVLVLAAFGLATMWMAVAADVGATLLVIANGMRLLGGPAPLRQETPRPEQAGPVGGHRGACCSRPALQARSASE